MHYVPPPSNLRDAHADRIRTFAFAGVIGILLLLNVTGIFRTIFGIDTAAILALVAGYNVFYQAISRLFAREISADLAIVISDTYTHPNQVRDAFRECFFPTLEPGQRVSAFAVGRRLKSRVDEPVRGDGVTLILRSRKSSPQGHAPAVYWVEVKADLPGDAPVSGGDGRATAGDVEP